MAEQTGVEEENDVPSQEELVLASKFFLYFLFRQTKCNKYKQ